LALRVGPRALALAGDEPGRSGSREAVAGGGVTTVSAGKRCPGCGFV